MDNRQSTYNFAILFLEKLPSIIVLIVLEALAISTSTSKDSPSLL